jgi:hypothetical protein
MNFFCFRDYALHKGRLKNRQILTTMPVFTFYAWRTFFDGLMSEIFRIMSSNFDLGFAFTVAIVTNASERFNFYMPTVTARI